MNAKTMTAPNTIFKIECVVSIFQIRLFFLLEKIGMRDLIKRNANAGLNSLELKTMLRLQ
jgi:hypothetical protein